MSTQSLVLQKVDRQPHNICTVRLRQPAQLLSAEIRWVIRTHRGKWGICLHCQTFEQPLSSGKNTKDLIKKRSRWIFYVPLFQYLQQTNYVTGIIVWSRIFNFIFNKIWFPLNFTLIPGACEHVKHETRSYSCHDKLNHINNPTTVVAALCCVVIELSTVLREISQCFLNK